ncbi:hypothetical protein B0H13DRAFT_1936378 [Mycena leptocephala]|nr:hypothetical protein B0H13DRAFT_1936378 [Mycena leptocephala]
MGDKLYEEAPVRFCSMDQCFNHQNLKECARCNKWKNWKYHKPTCDHNVAQLALVDNEEPLMQRNLRHWVVRFDATLHMAIMRGLLLKQEWERIDQGGLMIWVEPRPHRNAGMFKNDGILKMLDAIGMADQYREVLPTHTEARERLQRTSGGTADYAKATVSRMSDAQYHGDWLRDLEDQFRIPTNHATYVQPYPRRSRAVHDAIIPGLVTSPAPLFARRFCQSPLHQFVLPSRLVMTRAHERAALEPLRPVTKIEGQDNGDLKGALREFNFSAVQVHMDGQNETGDCFLMIPPSELFCRSARCLSTRRAKFTISRLILCDLYEQNN